MPNITPLKLVSAEKCPRPIQPEEVDDDEELVFSLPAGVAETLAGSVGNQGPATQEPRPDLGWWGRLFDWNG